MSQEPKQYKVLISTDPGKVRALNEDNFVLNKTVRRAESPFQHVRARSLREPLLCGVFDGMGGEKGGREASEIAARIAVEYYLFLSKSRVDPSGSIGDFVSNCNSQIKGYLDEASRAQSEVSELKREIFRLQQRLDSATRNR